jgi:DNA-binding NtrC family response regulator
MLKCTIHHIGINTFSYGYPPNPVAFVIHGMAVAFYKMIGDMTMAEISSSSPGSQPISGVIKPPQVLIAEDEKLLRIMMARLLQVSGYRVYTCSDGHQALNLIEKHPFDLVITDLMMAGASGMEVLRTTRRIQPRAKVIITTGTPSSETLLEAKYEGAYAYLRKPLQLKHFLSILKDAVEHSRLRDGYEYRRRLEVEAGNAEHSI